MTARTRTRPVLAGAALVLAGAFVLPTGSARASGPPAPAVAGCTVNGRPVTGGVVTGTEGFDEIDCPGGVPAGVVVAGGGGTDVITVDGGNAGAVDGGGGADLIEINGENSGRVTGGDGDDLVDLIGDADANSGTVSGGPGDDVLFLKAVDIAGNGVVSGDTGSDVCLFDPDPSGARDCEVVV
ncbi:hypothetical protein [Actinacidiphila sp. bgisy160]|uniref:hypothetical protein n=1 Tax=Actinacidiphila sp. bgisy160 TaxID=3413796 RepID=UPI003D76444B